MHLAATGVAVARCIHGQDRNLKITLTSIWKSLCCIAVELNHQLTNSIDTIVASHHIVNMAHTFGCLIGKTHSSLTGKKAFLQKKHTHTYSQ